MSLLELAKPEDPIRMKSPKTLTKTLKKKTTPGSAARRIAPKTIDPLYVIFEQHLFNFADPDSDRKTFITQVVTDYLSYLRKNNIIVPKSLEQPIVEELGVQVNTMLVKKIYGCLNTTDLTDPVAASMRSSRRRVKTRVAKAG
jgi:hypothetical protein